MWILDPAPSTKYSEVTDIWLLTSEEFIGSLLEEFVKIYPVDDVARSINCLNPEVTRRLVLIKHRSSHLNKSSILALCDAILLRCVRSRELMSDTHGIQVEVEAGVLELNAVVASDVFDLDTVVRMARLAKRLKTSCTSVL